MSPSRPISVLVTGGAGFIGAAAVRALLARRARVVVVDDLSAGSLAALPQHPALRLVESDVRDARGLAALLAEEPRTDAILHLAARVGVRTVLADPGRCAAENVAGVEAVLAAVRATPPERRPRVLAASSSEVYADSAEPLTEGGRLRRESGGRWAYAASKLTGEARLDAARELWPAGAGPVHLRFFNVVGPGQDSASGMVLPRFVEAALHGRALEVYGDGRAVRTFAHVDDVAADLATLITERAAPKGPLNLGGAARADVLELAHIVAARAEALGLPRPEIARVDPARAVAPGFRDVRHRVPDLCRARSLGLALATRTLQAIVDDMFARHGTVAREGVAADRERATRKALGRPAESTVAPGGVHAPCASPASSRA